MPVDEASCYTYHTDTYTDEISNIIRYQLQEKQIPANLPEAIHDSTKKQRPELCKIVLPEGNYMPALSS